MIGEETGIVDEHIIFEFKRWKIRTCLGEFIPALQILEDNFHQLQDTRKQVKKVILGNKSNFYGILDKNETYQSVDKALSDANHKCWDFVDDVIKDYPILVNDDERQEYFENNELTLSENERRTIKELYNDPKNCRRN